MKIIRVYFVTL